MRHLITVCSILLIGVPATTWACTKDTDCKGDRICVSGACAEPTEPARRTVSKESTPAEAAAGPGGTRSFHFNLLGLLQFGLTPTLEFGGQTTVLLGARLMNTGALSYLVTAQNAEDFLWGLGAFAQVRRYLGPHPQHGTYFGGGLEWMHTATEGDAVYGTTYAVPQLAGGYRWGDQKTYSAIGVFLGAAIPLSTENYDLEDAYTYFTGGFHWDLGWYV